MAQKNQQNSQNKEETNPSWYLPLMITFLVVGLLWVLVFYITQGSLPIPQLGNGNILVGFGIAAIGFFMSMNWK